MAKAPKQPKSKTMSGNRTHWPSFFTFLVILILAVAGILYCHHLKAQPAPIPDLMDYQIDSLTLQEGFELKRDYVCTWGNSGNFVPTYIFRNRGFYVLARKATQLDFYYQGEKLASYKLKAGVLLDLGRYDHNLIDTLAFKSLANDNRVVFLMQSSNVDH